MAGHILTLPNPYDEIPSVDDEEMTMTFKRIADWNQSNKEVAKRVELDQYEIFFKLVESLNAYVAPRYTRRIRSLNMSINEVSTAEEPKSNAAAIMKFNDETMNTVPAIKQISHGRKMNFMKLARQSVTIPETFVQPTARIQKKPVAYMPGGHECDMIEFLKSNNY